MLFIYLSSSCAWPIGPDYRCNVERMAKASGEIDKFDRKIYLNKEFTVERRTGMMSGALKNSYITDPIVIDYGSTGNAYKIVTTMRVDQGIGEGSNIFALNILEYKQSPQKPFVFLSNEMVFLGTACVFRSSLHFSEFGRQQATRRGVPRESDLWFIP